MEKCYMCNTKGYIYTRSIIDPSKKIPEECPLCKGSGLISERDIKLFQKYDS